MEVNTISTIYSKITENRLISNFRLELNSIFFYICVYLFSSMSSTASKK